MAATSTESIKYLGSPVISPAHIPTIAPKDIMSMVREHKPSPSSHGYGGDYSYSLRDEKFYFRTSGNLFEFIISQENLAKYGYPVTWEEEGSRTEGWDANANDNMPNDNDYVTIPKISHESGAIESMGERRSQFHIRDTAIPKYLHDFQYVGIPNNSMGFVESRIETARQKYLNFLGSKDGRESYIDLLENGMEPLDIDYVGVGLLGEDGIMGVSKLQRGDIVLNRAWDAAEKIAISATRSGMNHKDYEELEVVLEEAIHLGDGSLKKLEQGQGIIEVESGTKQLKYNYLLKRARESEGDYGKVARYLKAAQEAKYDLETVGRYAKKSNLSNRNQESGLEILLKEFANEESHSENYDDGDVGENSRVDSEPTDTVNSSE